MFCARTQSEIDEPQCWNIVLGTVVSAELQMCAACVYGKRLAETCPYRPHSAGGSRIEELKEQKKQKSSVALLSLIEAWLASKS